MGRTSTGTVLHLGSDEGTTRHRVLKLLGAASAGVAGLSSVIERAYGARPDGVPLVHANDVSGDPDKVRIVPQERYRRLQVYANLPISKLGGRYDALNGVRITQRSNDETDLALQFLVNNNTREVRRKLPSR